MAAGDAIGCFGLTEPDSGSDPGGCAPGPPRRRRLDPRRPARCGSPTAGRRRRGGLGPTDDGIRGFLVRATPGFTAPVIHEKMSLRASITSELVLDDVRLPADALLPEASRAARAAVLPERGTVRDHLGRGRRGARLFRRARLLRWIARCSTARSRATSYPAEAGRHGAGARRPPARAAVGRLKDAGGRTGALSLGKLDNVREALEIARTAHQSSVPTGSPSSTRCSATRTTSNRCSPTRARARSTPGDRPAR